MSKETPGRAGHAVQWDGSNPVGRLNDDASLAAQSIEAHIESLDSEMQVQVWDAGDWLGGSLYSSEQAAEYGITAGTSDEMLEEIARGIEDDAKHEGVDVLENIVEYCQELRQHLIDEAE